MAGSRDKFEVTAQCLWQFRISTSADCKIVRSSISPFKGYWWLTECVELQHDDSHPSISTVKWFAQLKRGEGFKVATNVQSGQTRKIDEICIRSSFQAFTMDTTMQSCKEKIWATFWYQCVADYSRILKFPAVALKIHSFTQTLQITVQIGLSILNPSFWNRLFGVNLGKVGIVRLNSSINWWVSVVLEQEDVGNCWICKSEFLFKSQLLRSWVWKLTILRGPSSNTSVMYVSYAL